MIYKCRSQSHGYPGRESAIPFKRVRRLSDDDLTTSYSSSYYEQLPPLRDQVGKKLEIEEFIDIQDYYIIVY